LNLEIDRFAKPKKKKKKKDEHPTTSVNSKDEKQIEKKVDVSSKGEHSTTDGKTATKPNLELGKISEENEDDFSPNKIVANPKLDMLM
jgi:hypothetical protein